MWIDARDQVRPDDDGSEDMGALQSVMELHQQVDCELMRLESSKSSMDSVMQEMELKNELEPIKVLGFPCESTSATWLLSTLFGYVCFLYNISDS